MGEIGKIENSRLQAMMEKLMPYNLNFLHVPGKENEAVDFGSRYPGPSSTVKNSQFPGPASATFKKGPRNAF